MIAAAMTPTDIGITAGAVLLLIYAARTMFSKEGKAQMGCGFAVAAAVLWSLALGRRIPEFTTGDALRLAAGALLLLPAFRALFQHGKGGVVSGAIGLVLASIVAGPVVQRYLEREGYIERNVTVEDQLVQTSKEIDRLQELRQGLVGDLATRKVKLDARGHENSAALANDPEAMALLREYSGFKQRVDDLDARLRTLEAERRKLAAAKAGDSGSLTESELERIRQEVTGAANVGDSTLLERFTEQRELLELYERELKSKPRSAPPESSKSPEAPTAGGASPDAAGAADPSPEVLPPGTPQDGR